MTTLYEHLQELAARAPERAAIVVCDVAGATTEEISHRALLERVEQAAAYLQILGLRSGDAVALDLGNGADLLILSWAAWSTGIITVPLDQKRDTAELRAYKVSLSGAKQVLTECTPHERATNIPWMTSVEHDALILFTSGTTARPKGARLTLQNLLMNANGIRSWLHITEADRFSVQLPLHHINSTTFCLSVLLSGGTIVIPPRYSNSEFFAQMAATGATLTSLVPSIVFDQLARTKEFDTVKNQLKLTRIQLGSAPVVVSDAQEFMRTFRIPLYQGYGQTETALRVTGVPTNLPPALYEQLVEENSIGTPMEWADVQVADDSGNILGEGEESELVVRGPAVMRGYLGDEPAFRDEWFLTGDIGLWKTVAGRRFFFLKGRKKEILIKGGVNISPVAVENVLKKMCADIDQAYVVGVADLRYGEEVGAAIVWKRGLNEKRAMRRLKLILLFGNEMLSAYETPRYIKAVSAEELPMTSTGKVQRSVLKERIAGTFEEVEDLLASPDFRFTIISTQSPLFDASHKLHNYCWQPLIKNAAEYKKYLSEYLTLGAVDKKGELAGQISFSHEDSRFICVSICSAAYRPKPIPETEEKPSPEFVREYLLAGNDPVMNFHTRLGAELIEVNPNGRPEDTSSLGYTMLLHYPPLPEAVMPAGPVSNQLIQTVRLLAANVGAEVFAVSRPGGLASFLSHERGQTD